MKGRIGETGRKSRQLSLKQEMYLVDEKESKLSSWKRHNVAVIWAARAESFHSWLRHHKVRVMDWALI